MALILCFVPLLMLCTKETYSIIYRGMLTQKPNGRDVSNLMKLNIICFGIARDSREKPAAKDRNDTSTFVRQARIDVFLADCNHRENESLVCAYSEICLLQIGQNPLPPPRSIARSHSFLIDRCTLD